MKYTFRDDEIEFLEDFLNYLNTPFEDQHSTKNSIKPEELKTFLNIQNSTSFYSKFYISSRKNPRKRREILAPDSKLLYIQHKLLVLLNEAYHPHSCIHGFSKGKNIVSNATSHIDQKLIIGIDIKNFFESTNKDMVFSALHYYCKDYPKILLESILDLCLYHPENSTSYLPTGSPTSPILSNMVFSKVDRKLVDLSKKYNLTYLRYADDLTFSTSSYLNIKSFFNELKMQIQKEGFNLNPKKTRFLPKNKRQMVTGIVVNEKLNVRRDQIKEVKFFLNLFKKYDQNQVEAYYNQRHNTNDQSIKLTLKGKIEFIGLVRGKSDTIYSELIDRYNNIFRSKADTIKKYKQLILNF